MNEEERTINEDPAVAEALFRRVSEFSTAYTEMIKLKIVDWLTGIVSAFVPGVLITSFLLFFLIFLNLGLALWLGELLNSNYAGFLAVSGFYLVIGLLIHFFFRKSTKKAAASYLIRQIFKVLP